MAEFLEREAYPGHLARIPPAAPHGGKAAAATAEAAKTNTPHTLADGQPVRL